MGVLRRSFRIGLHTTGIPPSGGSAGVWVGGTVLGPGGMSAENNSPTRLMFPRPCGAAGQGNVSVVVDFAGPSGRFVSLLLPALAANSCIENPIVVTAGGGWFRLPR